MKRKINANELNAKLGHPGEYWVCATINHLHYSVKSTLEVCEDYAMEKRNNKLLRNVAEERDLKTG